MKTIGKALLFGLGVALLLLVFAAFVREVLLTGLPDVVRTVVAVGAFLAAELAVCTGVVLNRLKK